MRTTFGYSESTYYGEKWTLPLKPPPQYLGQGNGDAPTIWEIVSTHILNWILDAGHGAVFTCCIPQDSLKLVGYFLVEDSNIIQIYPSPTTQAKYTIKLSQSGFDLLSEAAQKTDGKVSLIGLSNGTLFDSVRKVNSAYIPWWIMSPAYIQQNTTFETLPKPARCSHLLVLSARHRCIMILDEFWRVGQQNQKEGIEVRCRCKISPHRRRRRHCRRRVRKQASKGLWVEGGYVV